MTRALKAILAVIILALSFAGPVIAGPFEDANAAYAGGDYADGLRLFRPLAEQGHAPAQGSLGLMRGEAC
jgi:hypothetical protein